VSPEHIALRRLLIFHREVNKRPAHTLAGLDASCFARILAGATCNFNGVRPRIFGPDANPTRSAADDLTGVTRCRRIAGDKGQDRCCQQTRSASRHSNRQDGVKFRGLTRPS
jgi:hypothetical protein